MSDKPKFDPSQPFDVPDKPKFDPNKPFEAVSAPKAEGFLSKAAGFGKALFSGSGEPIGESIPVIGPLGRAAGETFRAAIETVGRDKPFVERFKEIHAEGDQRAAAFAKENPAADTTKKVIGAVGSLGLPLPGGATKGAAGVAARIGGAAGTMGTDQLLRTGDPKKAAQGAVTAGALQTGLEAISPLAGKAYAGLKSKSQEISQSLEEIANVRALKASTGQNKSMLRKIAKTKGVQEAGQVLGTGNEIVKEPVVKFGSSIGSIHERSADAADKAWKAVEDVYKAVDSVTGGKSIQGAEVADAILTHAQKIPELAKNKGVIDKLVSEAEAIQNMGPLSLQKAQELKNNFIFKITDPNTHALGLDGNNVVREAFTDAIETGIARTSPDLSETWKKGMKLYGTYASAAGAASDREIANISNRFISPSDYATGTAAALYSGLSKGTESALKDSLLGTVAAVGHKVVRERGSSMASVTARGISNLLRTNPKALGPYYPQLAGAAKNGAAALEAAHTLLLEKDPKYREMQIPVGKPSGMPMVRPEGPMDRRVRQLGE